MKKEPEWKRKEGKRGNDSRTCLRKKEKSLGRKCATDLAEGGHKVTDRAVQVADDGQAADGKKIIRLR